MRRIAITATAVLLSLAVSAQAASADTCWNASRPAPTGNQPLQTGNWYWLPQFGPGLPEIWVFATPGGFFNEKGNFGGATEAGFLLANSAVCDSARPTDRGIQNGCQ